MLKNNYLENLNILLCVNCPEGSSFYMRNLCLDLARDLYCQERIIWGWWTFWCSSERFVSFMYSSSSSSSLLFPLCISSSSVPHFCYFLFLLIIFSPSSLLLPPPTSDLSPILSLSPSTFLLPTPSSYSLLTTHTTLSRRSATTLISSNQDLSHPHS